MLGSILLFNAIHMREGVRGSKREAKKENESLKKKKKAGGTPPTPRPLQTIAGIAMLIRSAIKGEAWLTELRLP